MQVQSASANEIEPQHSSFTKRGGTFDMVSPTHRNVRGTCPPVPPWSDAHDS